MSLAGIIEQAEQTTKTLRVSSAVEAAELEHIVDHLGPHNVTVVTDEDVTDPDTGEPLAVLEDADGVVASAPVADLSGYATNWRQGFGSERFSRPELFNRLDDTYFRSYGKQRMIIASRSIEQRAWEGDGGSLHVGFQYLSKVRPQWQSYRDLAETVTVHVYGEPDWDVPDDAVVVHAHDTEEIRDHWWVAYDGNGDDRYKAALLAQEREPNEFYGFWTFDAGIVDDIIDHLEATYQ